MTLVTPPAVARACRVLTPHDPDWPNALGDLDDTEPSVLWLDGTTDTIAGPSWRNVAIVGTRAPTPYGHQVATILAGGLAEAGYTIVAGDGTGIDAAAHRAALAAGGRSIAVTAGGIDRPSPPGNAALLRQIATRGALLSEDPPGTPATRHRATQRARLVAALSATVVVIEATTHTAALRVAERALSLGRTVAGVPGPVTALTSAGVHRLIQDGETHLVCSVEDVIELAAVA